MVLKEPVIIVAERKHTSWHFTVICGLTRKGFRKLSLATEWAAGIIARQRDA